MADWWARIRALEPARVRAVWVAVVALLLSLGYTVSADVDGRVQAAIMVLAAVLPLIQGEATRAKVTPVAAADWHTDDDGDDIITEGE